MLRFKNILKFLPNAQSVYKNAKRQNQFIQPFLDEVLSDLLKKNDGSLQKKDLRRMKDYPFQFIVFFGDIFSQMFGKKLTDLDRERLTLYAAFLCLYDDFFDEDMLSATQIWNLFENPKYFDAQNTKEQTAQHLLILLFEDLPNQHLFSQYFKKFYDAQLESKSQFQKDNLSKDEIKQISFQKGGFALVLSRLLMDNPLKENELDAVYELGAWFQILDDIVDIHKDRKDKIRTLVTTAQKIEEIATTLQHQTEKSFQMIRSLSYQKSNTENALYQFFMIGSSGWIHLRRLRKLEKKSKAFLLDKYADAEIQWIENRFSNLRIGLFELFTRKY